MLKNIGSTELLIILAILLLLFGGSKLKDLARGLGESTKELKKVKKEYDDALKDNPLSDDPDQDKD